MSASRCGEVFLGAIVEAREKEADHHDDVDLDCEVMLY